VAPAFPNLEVGPAFPNSEVDPIFQNSEVAPAIPKSKVPLALPNSKPVNPVDPVPDFSELTDSHKPIFDLAFVDYSKSTDSRENSQLVDYFESLSEIPKLVPDPESLDSLPPSPISLYSEVSLEPCVSMDIDSEFLETPRSPPLSIEGVVCYESSTFAVLKMTMSISNSLFSHVQEFHLNALFIPSFLLLLSCFMILLPVSCLFPFFQIQGFSHDIPCLPVTPSFILKSHYGHTFSTFEYLLLLFILPPCPHLNSLLSSYFLSCQDVQLLPTLDNRPERPDVPSDIPEHYLDKPVSPFTEHGSVQAEFINPFYGLKEPSDTLYGFPVSRVIP
jgi:hypothetical protein